MGEFWDCVCACCLRNPDQYKIAARDRAARSAKILQKAQILISAIEYRLILVYNEQY